MPKAKRKSNVIEFSTAKPIRTKQDDLEAIDLNEFLTGGEEGFIVWELSTGYKITGPNGSVYWRIYMVSD